MIGAVSVQHRIRLGLSGIVLALAMTSCALLGDPESSPTPALPNHTPPPTPSAEVLRVSGTTPGGARLRVTIPSVELLARPEEATPQLFAVLADPTGTYSYALTPANRAGIAGSKFELMEHPLEISLRDGTEAVMLWLLAVDNQRYEASEEFGLDALAASLGFGFRNWVADGDPRDDPLAAVISASDGALFDWFAAIQVIGQTVIALEQANDWDTALASHNSPDGGLSVVYTTRLISEQTVAQYPTPTPHDAYPGYTLRLDEQFIGAESDHTWYQGQDETYTNRIINGAYEIHLSALVQRDYGLSWGSLEGELFTDYIVEADVQLREDDVKDARYGIWFNYQDDYNFIYFGVSNQGEYRAAVIQRNSNRIELQDWTPHPAIRRGAATNTLTIRSVPDGDIILSVNGDQLAIFNNQTFISGSIAFFCYAESVPATCHLNRLRVWERVE